MTLLIQWSECTLKGAKISIINRKVQLRIKPTVRYYFILVSCFYEKTHDSYKCWWGFEEKLLWTSGRTTKL